MDFDAVNSPTPIVVLKSTVPQLEILARQKAVLTETNSDVEQTERIRLDNELGLIELDPMPAPRCDKVSTLQ